MKNICIAGCGNIGRKHAKNLKGRAQLYFHSRSAASARALCDLVDGRGVFQEFEQVLASDAVDAIVLATPPQFHSDQTIKTLRSGKAVLVEKPLCTSATELREIETALNEQEWALLMVAENYYYKPSLSLFKTLIADDAIGAIERVEVQKLFRQSSTGWRTHYGALLEGGIHFVALIGDLVDEVPAGISAHFPGWNNDGQPERHCELQLTYRDGASACLRYAWDVPSFTKGLLQHSRIIGARGRIVFESNGLYAVLKGKRRAFLPPNLSDLMGFGRMMGDFLRCLEDRSAQPYSNFARARRDLDVVFRAYSDHSTP
jgi:predicted dehydrogenase